MILIFFGPFRTHVESGEGGEGRWFGTETPQDNSPVKVTQTVHKNERKIRGHEVV